MLFTFSQMTWFVASVHTPLDDVINKSSWPIRPGGQTYESA